MSGPVTSAPNAASLTPLLRLPRKLETDLTVTATGDSLKAQGDIFLGRAIIPTAVSNALNSVPHFGDVAVKFQPSVDRYEVTGKVKVGLSVSTAATLAGTLALGGAMIPAVIRNPKLIALALPAAVIGHYAVAALGRRLIPDAVADKHLFSVTLPVSASTAVRMDGPTVVLSDTQFKFPGSGFGFVTNAARGFIADTINGEGISTTRAGKDIRIDGTSLLHEVGILPAWASLASDQAASVKSDETGNIAIHLGSGPAGTADGVSRIRANFDPAASQRVLKDLFGSQYTVRSTSFADGRAEVKGTTTIPEIRATVNAVAGTVVALLGGGLGTLLGGNEPMSSDPAIPLNMSLRTQGTSVFIKPSLSAAIKPVADALTSATNKPTIANGEVQINASSLLPGGTVDKIQVTPDGLAVDASLNADSFLGDALRKAE